MNQTKEQKKELTAHLKDLSLKIIEEKGWRPFRDIQVELLPEDVPLPFMFCITLHDRKIRLHTCHDIYPILTDLQQTLKMKIEEMEEIIFYFSICHEYGHHKYCPQTKERFQDILLGIFEAVHEKECSQEVIKQLCVTISNLFEDTVLNTIYAHTDVQREKYRKGLGLIYNFAGHYQKKHAKTLFNIEFLKPRADKAMTLFTYSNFFLCNVDDTLFKPVKQYQARFFPNVDRLLVKLITVFTGDKEIAKKILTQDVESEECRHMINRLQDQTLWKQMAFDYANIIYYLLQNNRQNGRQTTNSFSQNTQGGAGQQNGQSSEQQKEDKKQGGGKQKKEDKKQGGGSSSKDNKKKENREKEKDKKQESGGSGEKKEQEKKDKQQSGTGKSDKKEEQKKDKKEEQQKPSFDPINEFLERISCESKDVEYTSPYVRQFSQLDELYKQRASTISLQADEQKHRNPEYDHLVGESPISLEEFTHKNIDWSSTKSRIVNGKRQIELFKKDTPLSFPIDVDVKEGGVPDLAFIFDSSISMMFDPLNAKGEYHYAVLAFYSILNDLEQKGVAPLLNYNITNFSEKSISSGWQSYDQMMLVKKAVFDYQGLGTEFDQKSLADLRINRRDNFIVFMLSDTGFNRSENAVELLIEVDLMVNTGGIGFYLFQLGPHSYFSQEVMKKGLPVQQIKSAEDFMSSSIQFTRELYGEKV